MLDLIELYFGKIDHNYTFDVDLDLIRKIRYEVRLSSRGGGMCLEVSEEMSNIFGFQVMEVAYLKPNKKDCVLPGSHFVCIMPNGYILDATADQLAEDEEDIRILAPSDPRYDRYRPAFYDDYNPSTHHELGEYYWTGEPDDVIARQQSLEVAFDHLDDVSLLRRYINHQRSIIALCDSSSWVPFLDKLAQACAKLESRAHAKATPVDTSAEMTRP